MFTARQQRYQKRHQAMDWEGDEQKQQAFSPRGQFQMGDSKIKEEMGESAFARQQREQFELDNELAEHADVLFSDESLDEYVNSLDKLAFTDPQNVRQFIYERVGSEEQTEEIAQHYFSAVGARFGTINKAILSNVPLESAERVAKAMVPVLSDHMPGAGLINTYNVSAQQGGVFINYAINPAWDVVIPAGGLQERVKENSTDADSLNDTLIRFFPAANFDYYDEHNTKQTINNIVGQKVVTRLSRNAPRGESADVNADQADLMKNILLKHHGGSNGNAKGWIRGHLLNDNLGGSALKFNLYPITGSANKEHHSRVESHVKELVKQGFIVEYSVEVKPAGVAKNESYNIGKNTRTGAAPKADFECTVKVLADTSTNAASAYHADGEFSITITSEFNKDHSPSGDFNELKAFKEKARDSSDEKVNGNAYKRPWLTKKKLAKPLSLGDAHLKKDYTKWTAKQQSEKFWTWDSARVNALVAALKIK